MNWKKFLLQFKKNNKKQAWGDHLDKQLIKNITRGRWPSVSQIKYLPRFLNSREKNIITTLVSLAFFTSFVWLIVFIIQHHGIVPKDGGEYSEAIIGQPKLINPIFANINDVDTDLVSLIYSGLFRYDQNGQLVGDLASDYKLSTDQKIYKINLRHDIKWSDGEPFTANDVIYTFEAILNPEVGSPLMPSFQGIGIEKIDDYTVSFTLKEPFSPFLNSLTLGILPEHVWDNFPPNGIKLSKENLQPTGTGPWMFSKLVKDDAGNIQSYSLTRNNNYYAKKPYLQNITFKFFEDYPQAVDALRQGDVLGLSFVPRNLKDKITSRDINLYQARLPQYTALFFNAATQPELKDDNLRLALAESIDKNLVLKESLDGEGIVVDSPILPGQLGYNPEATKIYLDVIGASAILDKNWTHIQPEEYFQIRTNEILKGQADQIADIKNNASTTPEIVSSTLAQINKQAEDVAREEMHLEQTFYRKNKNGQILSLTITTADTPEYHKTAETVANMWRAIGIVTNIVFVAPRQITQEALHNRNYQVLLYGEIVGSDPDPFPFWHSSQVNFPGLNLSGFADRNADKLLEDARATNDQTARADAYKKFQDLLVKKIPAIFLYSPNYIFAVNKQIQGVTISNISSPTERFDNLNDWYSKTKWTWKKQS